MTKTDARSARVSTSPGAGAGPAAAGMLASSGGAGVAACSDTLRNLAVDRGGDDDGDGDEESGDHRGDRLAAVLAQLLPQVVRRDLVDHDERHVHQDDADHRV